LKYLPAVPSTLRRSRRQGQSNFKKEGGVPAIAFEQFKLSEFGSGIRISDSFTLPAPSVFVSGDVFARKAKLGVTAMVNAAPLQQGPATRPNVPQELPPEDSHGRNTSPELSGLFHKIHRNWQDYGLTITAKKTLAYLVRSIYFRQVYRIYRINLRLADPNATARWDSSNFTFKILTAENRDAIAQIETIAEWLRGQLQEAIAAGQPCLVALDGDRVAGFNLISLDNATIPLVNLTRRLRNGSAWSEHIAVRKEYRRVGLGAQLRLRIFRELERRGVRRLYGGTLLSNTASLTLARSVGFKEIADIHYRKFFSREKWRYKRVRG
jgi:GNAT superfamily N-acetyltransferase